MNQRFPKKYRLKNKSKINRIFEKGIKLVSYPIKVMSLQSDDYAKCYEVAFSVPKRSFAKAVDRNRIKRLMRESFRLQHQNYKIKQSLFIIYIGKNIPDYQAISNSLHLCLSKLTVD